MNKVDPHAKNPRDRHSVRTEAERAAAARLLVTAGPTIFREAPAGYAVFPEQNLVPGVTLSDFSADLSAGAGNELIDTPGGPAKFCAAFSSSALVVNTFGVFRRMTDRLELLGTKAFTDAQFEKKLPTGLRGTDPHLDFFASGPGHVICIESKFLEPLSPKRASFADSYEMVMQSLAEPAWVDMYRELKRDPQRFKYLDAAQLVKHYLGMRNTLGSIHADQILVYLYWEPENAADIEDFLEHRKEVAAFGTMVDGSHISFVALSYPQLWSQWEEASDWDGMPWHLANLRQRYAFAI